MKRHLLSALLPLAAAPAWADSPLDYPSVWTCDTSKPHWYCDDEPPPPSRATAPETYPRHPAIRPLPVNEIRTAEQMRQELKRREDVAVMDPTPANLKHYLELWQVVQDKGSVFADTWQRVVWQNPNLDYSLRRPANNTAIRTFEAQREAAEERHLKALARDHGLIFFFRSDCPYCHAMAPVLKGVAGKYGFEVLPVSVDGAALLPEFPRFTDGRRSAAAWGVERVPALFIGSRATGDRAPIGFGQMSLSEIINRIFVLTGTQPGQEF